MVVVWRVLVVLAVLAGLAPLQALAAYFGNKTTMTFDPGHGTQVEYVAANGTNYLWYPGNRGIVPGHWKISGGNICWRYPDNSYNPVTGQMGGWECEPKAVYASTITEQVTGDVFGLAHHGAVPFQLPKKRTSIAALLKLAKAAPVQ